jgi:DNA polymerase III gamma/tau subunit
MKGIKMERDTSLPLHLKYRPQTFDEVIGNESAVESLRTILSRQSGEVRTFLFIGSSGCGKTTLARIIKNELGCSDRDFVEYNSANVRGIDTIREIAESCRYSPMSGLLKIYLLDEAQKLTGDAQNALLKLLEDTPKHVRFILCTTDPDKLIKTIKTRCSTFQVSLLRRNQTLKLLKWICKEEKVEMSDKVLLKVADYSEGSPRQAVVMLDQVIDIEDEEQAMQTLLDSSVSETTVLDLCQKLLTKSKWKDVSDILKNIEDDPEKVRLAILGYMSKVLLSSGNSKARDIMRFFEEPFYNGGKSLLIGACFDANNI